MLSVARLEEGKIVATFEVCDIRTLIKETCGNYQDLNPDYVFIMDVERLPSAIVADHKLLRQVMSNLLSNAVKYTPDGQHIWITASEDPPDHIMISVRDEGVGIPNDEIDRLFSRFFRASTSTGIPASDIGLHLVKYLIDLHRGDINVISEKGEGTTFILRLLKAPSNDHSIVQRL